MTIDNAHQILHQYWGYDNFRGVQKEIIESILSGRDTLGLMPTGGGKSLCFQVPALALPGLALVVTPLIALMKDQVDHLRRQGVNATAVYSGMTREEIGVVLDNCILGNVKLLYISPERLSSDLFQNKVKRMRVSFITVDEAHCISQWGYDFRPAYLEIAKVREMLGAQGIPILGLTATATPRVIADIQKQLLFREENVIKMSFARPNLAYVVRQTNDKMGEMVHILKAMPYSTIIYVRSRKRCKEISDFLNNNTDLLSTFNTQHSTSSTEGQEEGSGQLSTYYHAGLDHVAKEKRQEAWQRGEVRVMVATNAFGMGIDKADVRLVLHVDCPDSLEAYFQEAGRAGRDGEKAYAVMLHSGSDDARLLKRVADTYPPKEFIRQVYDELAYFYEIAVGAGYGETHEFSIERFCAAYRHYPLYVDSALSILHQAGYIHYESDPHNASRLRFILGRDDLYRLHEGSKQETLVMTSLLRTYGGLFVDYCYIDESRLADITGLDRTVLYQILKGLDEKYIVSYIPQRSIPLITFTQSREEGEDIVIPEAVYERRRQQLQRNIDAVISYTNNDYVCRSRQLLAYFGEQGTKSCGICDVCRAERKMVAMSDDTVRDVCQMILQLLEDKESHSLDEVKHLPADSDLIDAALRQLLDEEDVVMTDSFSVKSTAHPQRGNAQH